MNDEPAGERSRVLVVTPTYNEAESLRPTLAALQEAAPEVHILVVDDGSPDGTGDIADAMAAADDRIHVMHRTAKNGLGAAYIAGFGWALEHGYDVIVEMDADGSHPAIALPAMLKMLESDDKYGLVIGSRRVEGGGWVDWPWYRQAISGGGNWYARLMLGIPVNDITAGYRAYRAATLAGMRLDEIDSRGYCFQIDMTIRTSDAGWKIGESPIQFRDRLAGTSKMSSAIVVEAMWRTTIWGIQRRFGGAKRG